MIRNGMLVVRKRLRKRLPIDMPILDINLNETKIEQVPNYKLLGVLTSFPSTLTAEKSMKMKFSPDKIHHNFS